MHSHLAHLKRNLDFRKPNTTASSKSRNKRWPLRSQDYVSSLGNAVTAWFKQHNDHCRLKLVMLLNGHSQLFVWMSWFSHCYGNDKLCAPSTPLPLTMRARASPLPCDTMEETIPPGDIRFRVSGNQHVLCLPHCLSNARLDRLRTVHCWTTGRL